MVGGARVGGRLRRRRIANVGVGTGEHVDEAGPLLDDGDNRVHGELGNVWVTGEGGRGSCKIKSVMYS